MAQATRRAARAGRRDPANDQPVITPPYRAQLPQTLKMLSYERYIEGPPPSIAGCQCAHVRRFRGSWTPDTVQLQAAPRCQPLSSYEAAFVRGQPPQLAGVSHDLPGRVRPTPSSPHARTAAYASQARLGASEAPQRPARREHLTSHQYPPRWRQFQIPGTPSGRTGPTAWDTGRAQEGGPRLRAGQSAAHRPGRTPGRPPVIRRPRPLQLPPPASAHRSEAFSSCACTIPLWVTNRALGPATASTSPAAWRVISAPMRTPPQTCGLPHTAPTAAAPYPSPVCCRALSTVG